MRPETSADVARSPERLRHRSGANRNGPEPDDWLFKVPSLLYVGGSAPYFHDGSEPSLASLIDHNGTRMGHTKQLSPADRAALVAFLETL